MTSTTGLTAIPLALLVLCTGCTETRTSNPERTAEEQLLLSTAVDRAVDDVTLNVPKGTKVFVDASRFEAYDKSYAISAFRDRVLESGAHLVSQLNDAEVIVEDLCTAAGDPAHARGLELGRSGIVRDLAHLTGEHELGDGQAVELNALPVGRANVGEHLGVVAHPQIGMKAAVEAH